MKMKTWEIERMFNEDVREKRKAGSGSFHKRGKGVKHGMSGALKTPYHYMSAKEKKKLNGEVSVYSMYETIIPLKEFKLKDIETQKLLLTRWREIYENDIIKEEMGLNVKSYYDLVAELNLPKKPRGGNIMRAARDKKPKKEAKIAISSQMKFETPETPATTPQPVLQLAEPQVQEIQPQMQKIIIKGLNLEYNGEYNAEDLAKIFTKLQLIIDGETNNYNLCLSLSEKTK
jgi:hypothetical protein